MDSLRKVNKNENSKYKGKIRCTECKSMNTLASNKLAVGSLVGFIMCCMAFGVSIFVPFLGFILAPIFLLATFVCLLGLIISPLTKDYTLVCKDCMTVYKINKKEYNKVVKKKLKD